MSDELRAITEADLAELYEVQRRAEIYDKVPLVTPWEEFEEVKDDPATNLAADSVMVLRDNRAIGFGRVWYRSSDDGDHARAFMMGAVDPPFRRQGVGSQILEWTMARGREAMSTAPPEQERFLRTFAFDFEHETIALYERHGLKPIRYFAELVRPLPEAIAVFAVEGVEITGWDPKRAEEVRQVMNLAFRDHWGTTPIDPASWEHRLGGAGTRLDLSYLAVFDDNVVGACLNAHFPDDQEVTGRLDGIIDQLGTHPGYRKRGIASALIETSCERFRQLGWDHAMLGVDSDNPTGAYHLYQRLGFQPLHRSLQHQLQV